MSFFDHFRNSSLLPLLANDKWGFFNSCWKIKVSFYDLIRNTPLVFSLPAIEIKIRIGMTFQKTKFCGGATAGCSLRADEPGVKVTSDRTNWPEMPRAWAWPGRWQWQALSVLCRWSSEKVRWQVGCGIQPGHPASTSGLQGTRLPVT